MTSRTLAATAAALLLIAPGCVHSNVDKHWGEAHDEMFARQTDDPDGAAENAGEPSPQGFDGATAEGAIGNYRSAQRGKAAPQLPLPMIVTDTDSAGSR